MTGLLWIACWLSVLGMPGMAIARRDLADEPAASRVGLGLAIGLLVVAWPAWALAAVIGLIVRGHLGWPWLVTTAAAVLLVVLRAARREALPPLRPAERADRCALALAATVAVVWGLHHDRTFFTQHHCMPGAAAISLTDTLSGRVADVPPEMAGRNLSLLARFGQREGAVALLASHLALLGRLGFRGALVFPAVIATLGAYGLGRRLWPDGARAAVALAALVGLSPVALTIHHPNPNLDAHALAVVVLALGARALQGNARPWLTGALAGLVVAVVHFMAPAAALFGVALFAARGDRGRGAARYAAGLAVACLPVALAHAAGLLGDDPSLFESFSKYPAVRHCLGGRCFDWHGLLAWPFVETWMRDPFRAHPASLRFPLEVLSRYGLVAVALAPVGALALGRSLGRRGVLAALAWASPGLALAAQGNWVDRAKSGALLPLLPLFAVAVVAGAVELARPGEHRRRALVVALVAALAAVAGHGIARRIDLPADPRVVPLYALDELGDRMPGGGRELPGHRTEDLRDTARLGLLPDLGQSHGGAVVTRWALDDTLRELSRPSLSAYEPTLPDRLFRLIGLDDVAPPGLEILAASRGGSAPGAPDRRRAPHGPWRAIELDLRRPLAAHEGWLTPAATPGSAAVPRPDEAPLLFVGLGSTWHGDSTTVAALASDRHALLVVFEAGADARRRAATRGAKVIELDGRERVTLSVPADLPIVVADLVSWEPAWDLTWLARPTAAGYRVEPAFRGLD